MKNKAKNLIPFLLLVLLVSGPTHAQIVDSINAPNTEDEKEAVDYDLTDQERYESQQFVHEGLLQRQIKEQCEGLKDSKACYGNGKTKFLGMDSSLIQGIAKMYSLFGGMISMAGDGMDFKTKTKEAETPELKPGETKPETETPETAENKEGGEKKKNYCVYIPAAGEAVATLSQQMGQQNIQNTASTETPQKDALYKAARSHETRAKTAKIQGTVWGATTACYAYYMTAGGVVLDTKTILQAAAAGFLTTYWFSEAKQQEAYAKEVKKIADNLPGKGDCNPHTQNNCYCSQPETMYDPVHCVPQLQAKALAKNSFAVPCVDKDLQADAKCDCVTADACFDSEFFSDSNLPGIGTFAASSAGKNFKSLTRGQLLNGKLSASQNGNSAAATRLLKDIAKNATPPSSLSKSQQGISDALTNAGLPAGLAKMMAMSPTTSAGKRKVASLGAGSSGSSGKTTTRRRSKGSNVLRFSNGLGKVGAQKKKSGTNFNSMLGKYKKKKTTSNKKVLKFANQAQKAAQIERNKDKPIFEIISRRYQVSGWRRLEIE